MMVMHTEIVGGVSTGLQKMLKEDLKTFTRQLKLIQIAILKYILELG